MREAGVLLVCRKCLEGIGRKGGRKRTAIREQIERLAHEGGLEVVKTGCLDVCPKKGVTIARVADKHDTPEVCLVLKPNGQPPMPSSSVEPR